MSRRRRRPSGPPRCNDCRRVVVWFGSPHGSGRRPFDPKVLSGHDDSSAGAFPVWANRAWRTVDLVAELMVARSCSSAEAESEARDLPWHRTHVCPSIPSDTEEGPTP